MYSYDLLVCLSTDDKNRHLQAHRRHLQSYIYVCISGETGCMFSHCICCIYTYCFVLLCRTLHCCRNVLFLSPVRLCVPLLRQAFKQHQGTCNTDTVKRFVHTRTRLLNSAAAAPVQRNLQPIERCAAVVEDCYVFVLCNYRVIRDSNAMWFCIVMETLVELRVAVGQSCCTCTTRSPTIFPNCTDNSCMF